MTRVTQCEENTHLAARWACEQSEKILGKYINDENFKLQMHEMGGVQCKIEGGTQDISRRTVTVTKQRHACGRRVRCTP